MSAQMLLWRIALSNVSGSGLARAINAGSPNNRKIAIPILRRRRYALATPALCAYELPPKPNSPEQKPMPAPTSTARNQGSEVIGQPIDRIIFLFVFTGNRISIWCVLNWCRFHAGFYCGKQATYTTFTQIAPLKIHQLRCKLIFRAK
jgi:hypothetical protein